jgi:hypothetical protein
MFYAGGHALLETIEDGHRCGAFGPVDRLDCYRIWDLSVFSCLRSR